ncbi:MULTISPECIES: Ycf66 family protein [Arthrospira]|jgi:hypothetical protein|uniref:Ycf66 protein n=1 Tax=Limnospira platensis NIES-46 TaxID=1236695 RepID=A0A5M3T5K0_LIMPL|nr:Ycf66 family protein [Arthrospira platensis]AMW30759.1 hypothetical protein AP285_25355 [Arthrospira platensis YZ]KDR55138.1 hypothetical protein APPUASWS_023865 [Arthrospira platensis str. Paraca]MBD2670377.1 Ycf66 family protein [Arthrospira platensis FACHB-439]MBD2710614.1 Ycf66 family protein [Arthrospira platensis FACHB-835]MDF2207233.1 Ycf66 family protein [Arthrospira platensis NCB002]MDT9183600.1 Ycf66 family protein [Limnospira sp. PMC 289.06]MDT9311482.1 Ycf66 family protein [Li
MVNLGLNWSSLLGIVLAVAGAALYFLRSWKPKLARDHDIFFAAVGLLCGGILLFQGWRLDPILAFGQFMLTGTAIFFAVESIKLRGVATTKAKERASFVDDDRYVSDVYRVDAELDEIEPVEEYAPMARQIRGTRESRPSRPDMYDTESERRRPSSRRTSAPNSSVERTRTRPRSAPSGSSRPPISDGWESDLETDSRPSRTRSSRPASVDRSDIGTGGYSYPDTDEPSPPRSRPSRSSRSANKPDRRDVATTDYVEYRPVDYSDDDYNRSGEY